MIIEVMQEHIDNGIPRDAQANLAINTILKEGYVTINERGRIRKDGEIICRFVLPANAIRFQCHIEHLPLCVPFNFKLELPEEITC